MDAISVWVKSAPTARKRQSIYSVTNVCVQIAVMGALLLFANSVLNV